MLINIFNFHEVKIKNVSFIDNIEYFRLKIFYIK